MNTEPITEKKPSRLIRALRWFAIGLVALLTLVALAYAVENFRGKRAWEKYRHATEQRATVFDFTAQIPPAVPEDQNGANVPLIQSWFEPRFRSKGDPTLWPDLFERADKMIASDKDKSKRRLVDLVAWQEALAAAAANEKRDGKIRSVSRSPQERAAAATNVLAALRDYEPAIEQLREAMKRPHIRYPVDYNTEQPFAILLPHLAAMRNTSRLITFRASAHLAANNSDAALQDVLMSLWLVDSLRDEHFLISYLVRVAVLQTVSHAVWEGMVQQRWTDAQLKQIQERAERLDFLRGLEAAFTTERAASMTTIDWIKQRQSGKRFESLGNPDATTGAGGFSVMTLAPRGWWDLEKVSLARILDEQTGPIVAGLSSGTLADVPDAMSAARKLRGGIGAVWRHEILAGLLLPAIDKVHRKAGMAQALTDQVVVACALERARLADGSYPPSLAALTPRFLPKPRRDVMSREPLMYRPEGKGYVLYSIGWNRRDDGGTPGKVLFDDERGDWVWRVQPVTATEFE